MAATVPKQSDSAAPPRVSVVMPVYNGREHLPAAVESVLAQTYRDLELVIVNDGSTDGAEQYVHAIDDPRVVVIDQENAGLPAACNAGIAASRGEFVARMDADDLSTPTRLARQVEFLDDQPDVGCVATQAAPFGPQGIGKGLCLPLDHESLTEALIVGKHAIVHGSVMVRRSLLEAIDGYWSTRECGEEYDLFLRLAEVTRLATVDEVLYHYRHHMQSMSGASLRRMRLGIDYACELARRRQAGRPLITMTQYQAARNQAPLAVRLWREVELHARKEYRIAMGEIYGGAPLRGRLRLGWAALCSPQLTLERLRRMFTSRSAAPRSPEASTRRSSSRQHQDLQGV